LKDFTLSLSGRISPQCEHVTVNYAAKSERAGPIGHFKAIGVLIFMDSKKNIVAANNNEPPYFVLDGFSTG